MSVEKESCGPKIRIFSGQDFFKKVVVPAVVSLPKKDEPPKEVPGASTTDLQVKVDF